MDLFGSLLLMTFSELNIKKRKRTFSFCGDPFLTAGRSKVVYKNSWLWGLGPAWFKFCLISNSKSSSYLWSFAAQLMFGLSAKKLRYHNNVSEVCCRLFRLTPAETQQSRTCRLFCTQTAPNTNSLPGLFSFQFFKWIEAIYCFPYVNFNSKSRLNIITADSFIFKASSCGKRLQWFLLYLPCQQCQIGLFLPCWVSCCKTVVARFLLFVPRVSQVSTHRHIFCSSITVRCLRSTMNPKICSCHWISHPMTVIFLLASAEGRPLSPVRLRLTHWLYLSLSGVSLAVQVRFPSHRSHF